MKNIESRHSLADVRERKNIQKPTKLDDKVGELIMNEEYLLPHVVRNVSLKTGSLDVSIPVRNGEKPKPRIVSSGFNGAEVNSLLEQGHMNIYGIVDYIGSRADPKKVVELIKNRTADVGVINGRVPGREIVNAGLTVFSLLDENGRKPEKLVRVITRR